MNTINITKYAKWYVVECPTGRVHHLNRKSVEYFLKKELRIPAENVKYALYLCDTEGQCKFAA